MKQLAAIERQIHSALKSTTANVIKIGRLLAEAHELVEYGDWLGWLRDNFGMSTATAYNYMNAAKLTDEFPTVGNLKIQPGALYAMTEMSDEAKREVVKAAKKSEIWLDRDDVLDIAKPIIDRTNRPQVNAKADAILDGSPPTLPEPDAPAPLPRDAILFDTLETGVHYIVSLQSASPEKLAQSEVPLADLEIAAALLGKIIEAKQRKAAA